MDIENKKKVHQQFAVETFNQTWELIERDDRDQADDDRMINAAHTSRYHWEIAGTGENIARGEWLISRVYAILNRKEPCLYHANRCLKVTLENNLKDFDFAFAYEAMARASNLAGDEVETAKYITLAKDAGSEISDPDDRKYFFNELKTIQQGIIE